MIANDQELRVTIERIARFHGTAVVIITKAVEWNIIAKTGDIITYILGAIDAIIAIVWNTLANAIRLTAVAVGAGIIIFATLPQHDLSITAMGVPIAAANVALVIEMATA